MVWLALVVGLATAAEEGPFTRTWTAEQGLGPRFNARSCASCHEQGGVGGAGAAERDVFTLPSGMVVRSDSLEEGYPAIRDQLLNPTIEFHEGMCGTAIMQMIASRTPVRRQTPALFGMGLLDDVSNTELALVERSSGRDHPEVSGRIPRDADGRPGRFGWKGQQPTLASSVANAAHHELGLEPDELAAADLAAMIAHVRSLDPPAASDAAGAQLMDEVGCTACHQHTIGEARGAYTDLLVHDMGPALMDEGAGYGFHAVASEEAAQPTEWRTPPLWGIALSAPYLHDGRAATLDDAIRAHGGEAAQIREAYEDLEERDREALLAYLGSLGG